MKTTLHIDPGTMKELKRRAAQEGRTISELVEAALRVFLKAKSPAEKLPPLPAFNCGKPRVNVANREALYDWMENR